MYQDDEYREAARRMHGSPGVTVSPHAIVSRAVGGAYVEMRLWVPDVEAEAIQQERDFNAGRHPAAKTLMGYPIVEHQLCDDPDCRSCFGQHAIVFGKPPLL